MRTLSSTSTGTSYAVRWLPLDLFLAIDSVAIQSASIIVLYEVLATLYFPPGRVVHRTAVPQKHHISIYILICHVLPCPCLTHHAKLYCYLHQLSCAPRSRR